MSQNVSETVSDTEFGPHTALLRAELLRLNAIPWLAPDAEMDALTERARESLRERLDEHFAALKALEPEFSPPPARVETFRSVHELAARARSVPESAASKGPKTPWGDPIVPAFTDEAARWLRVLERATTLSYAVQPMVAPANAAFEQVPHVSYKLAAEHPLRAPWLDAVWSSGAAMNHPGFPAMGAHLRWLAAYGAEKPSPWEPILALFERGVYPLVTSDAALAVWVPLRSEGRVVPDASGEVRELARARVLTPSVDDKGVRAFHEQGFAAIPVLLAYPPTPNLPAPNLRPPPVAPPRASPYPTPTPNLPVPNFNPPPVVPGDGGAPGTPPSASTAREPWYRRWFKP